MIKKIRRVVLNTDLSNELAGHIVFVRDPETIPFAKELQSSFEDGTIFLEFVHIS